MANEITLNLKLSVLKSYLNQRFDPGVLTSDMTGSTAAGGVQNIGTTAETLGVTDVTTCGWSYFRNTDSTNYVELGTGTAGSFVAFAKLKAGEACVLRLGTNAPTARANTAAINLQYFIFQD